MKTLIFIFLSLFIGDLVSQPSEALLKNDKSGLKATDVLPVDKTLNHYGYFKIPNTDNGVYYPVYQGSRGGLYCVRVRGPKAKNPGEKYDYYIPFEKREYIIMKEHW